MSHDATPSETGGFGPVGAGDYEVRQGECLVSIAARAGHVWKYIWKQPQNDPLRDARRDPTALLPGDHLYIPPLRRKDEKRATEARHVFRRKGVPSKIRIRLLDNGDPRADQPYTLTIGPARHAGRTDGQGELEHPLDPAATEAELVVGEGVMRREYKIALGDLDPIVEPTGTAGRLANLGYRSAATGGSPLRVTEALQDFQRHEGLEVTGQLDDETRAALQQRYDK
ncbi:MAG: peptidoglycan-binding protein [Polyangiaceae bacterium]|nr:peptidoglycan-binding protein [Polyangiaceae bacterium]